MTFKAAFQFTSKPIITLADLLSKTSAEHPRGLLEQIGSVPTEAASGATQQAPRAAAPGTHRHCQAGPTPDPQNKTRNKGCKQPSLYLQRQAALSQTPLEVRSTSRMAYRDGLLSAPRWLSSVSPNLHVAGAAAQPRMKSCTSPPGLERGQPSLESLQFSPTPGMQTLLSTAFLKGSV